MDLDHEKIPFIDERNTVNMAWRNFPNSNQQGNPQNILEMESMISNEKANNPEMSEGRPRFEHDSTFLPPSTLSKCMEDGINPAVPTNSQCDSDVTKNLNLVVDNVVEGESRNSSFKFPLHTAAERGNVKILERLLVKGDPLVTDFKQRTPLHYACSFAYQKKALRMMDAILKCPRAQNTPDDGLRKKRLIDFQDKNGETALHLAARTGHRQVVEKLLFSAADVNLKDKNDLEPLHVIYSKVPAAMIPVYDGAVECKIGDPQDQNLTVRFDFGAIVGYPEIEKDISLFAMETKLLSYCLQLSEQKRTGILLHPIVQVFLFLKWKKIRILLWMSILFHVIWLLLYTLFITDLYLLQCPYRRNEEGIGTGLYELASNNETDSNISNSTSANSLEMDDENKTDAYVFFQNNETTCEIGKELHSSLNIKLGFLFFVSISVALKELYEIYSTPQLKFYFFQLENVGQWVLIGVVGLTSIPVFWRVDDDSIVIHSWQYQLASLGIFLAWSLILSQIGKIPRFGIYIEILGKVLRSFVMFMITFASLLVAFTLSFQIMMPEKPEFQSFPWSFMKVMIMMVGEINYDEVFYSDETSADIPFPTSTKILYACFVSIVTIILFNLLIGLTVSDTQGLQSVAQLTSLSSQLDQIYLMEKFIISKKLQRWLKRLNKNHWLRYFLVTQQTNDLETNMGVDIHISKIPTNLQHPVRDIAIPNIGQENDQDDDNEDDDENKDSASLQESSSKKLIDNPAAGNELVNMDQTITSSTTSISTVSMADLKEQIRDVLRELLEELKNANRNTEQ